VVNEELSLVAEFVLFKITGIALTAYLAVAAGPPELSATLAPGSYQTIPFFPLTPHLRGAKDTMPV